MNSSKKNVVVIGAGVSGLAFAHRLQELAGGGSALNIIVLEEGRIPVAPYTPPNVDPDLERLSDGLATRLFRVTVDVSFPGANGVDRTLSLATIKIGPRSSL